MGPGGTSGEAWAEDDFFGTSGADCSRVSGADRGSNGGGCASILGGAVGLRWSGSDVCRHH